MVELNGIIEKQLNGISLASGLTAEDRIAAIQSRLQQSSSEQRLAVRNIIDKWLHYMCKTDASDIDVGGYGCKGKI